MGGEERRQYNRVKCEIEAFGRVLEAHSTVPPWETSINDISEGGVRFKSNYFISVGSKFLIKLNIPHFKTVEVITQPAWVRELPGRSQYDVGARFVDLGQEDKSVLRSFIRSQSQPA